MKRRKKRRGKTALKGHSSIRGRFVAAGFVSFLEIRFTFPKPRRFFPAGMEGNETEVAD